MKKIFVLTIGLFMTTAALSAQQPAASSPKPPSKVKKLNNEVKVKPKVNTILIVPVVSEPNDTVSEGTRRKPLERKSKQ